MKALAFPLCEEGCQSVCLLGARGTFLSSFLQGLQDTQGRQRLPSWPAGTVTSPFLGASLLLGACVLRLA